MEWDDFEYDVSAASEGDKYERSARDTLGALFEEQKQRVFVANQLAVLHERKFFHWVTSRAIDDLIGEGIVKMKRVGYRRAER